VSKCIEKIAFKYIFNHLIFNSLLYKFQSGFIPGYSTTHQLVELYHNILLALDNKEMTSITFADVSKAFDRVWIRGLILKLERYGVKGELLCWLKSYLSNRCQRVIIKDAISSVGELKAGVPQGSVLGPLLFLIFINDIADDMLGLGRLFADDTSIGHTAHDENTLKNMINIDLKYIQKWSKRWLVKFNPSKTDIMVFSANNQQNDLIFDFNSTLIQTVNTHKHLGVIFSCDCKWTKHINTIIERASKQLNILRKLKFKLNRQYLENIYITFIRPILEYGSEVWDNCGAVNSDRLEKVQTEAARIVTGLTSYASLDSIYCETGWEKLTVRREVKKLNLFYKIINNEAPEYLSELIPPTVAESNNYNLRNRHNISQPANRLSKYQNSFFPSTIKTWNTLDLNIREVPTFFTFKKRLQFKYFRNKKIPCYFSSGDRYLNVLQSRLRNRCSALNSDLYRANLIPNALCSCGKSDETAKHLLLHCKNYIVQRNIFLIGIREISNDLPIDELTLLSGNEILNDEKNTKMFLPVQKFIQDTGCFTIN
jgi:hypothetical protein